MISRTLKIVYMIKYYIFQQRITVRKIKVFCDLDLDEHC
jgi:hypothetical protein